MVFENFLNYLKAKAKETNKIDIDKSELMTALEGEKVPTINGFQTITIELLKMFTDNKKLYLALYEDLVENNNDKITLKTIDEIGYEMDYEFNKFKIIDALEWANSNNKLTEDEIEKLKILKMSAQYTNFIDKYKEDTMFTNIEGKFITLPVKEFIDIMDADITTIEQEIEQGKHKDITIEEFVYALDTFLDENKILDKYYIPENVSQNLSKLRKEIDITFMNQFLDFPIDHVRKIRVNEKLKREVLGNMKEDFTSLEKAFYIYYKLCTLLTYDDEQYAKRENKEYEINHKDLNRIPEINSENNRIVCYEFNTIYARFLKDLDIKYQITGDRGYGNGHASLVFRVDKFIIKADSTIGLIKSDLSYAKNGLILKGFTLENDENPKTYDSYVEQIDNVYTYINEYEESQYFGTIRGLNRVERTLPKDLSLDSKINIFISMTNDSNLPVIDKIPYQIKMKKMFFQEESDELAPKFKLNFVSYREPIEQEKYSTSTLISYNDKGLEDNIKTNKYIQLKSNGDVENYNYDQLKYSMEMGNIRGTLNDNRCIPGFTLSETKGDFSNEIKIHK